MKFKDNIFYKAVAELKEKSNNFKPKGVEYDYESKSYFYDFDIGVSLILAKLLDLGLTDNQDCVSFEFIFDDYEPKNKAYNSPSEALEMLKNREINDLKMIFFVRDYENMYFTDTFHFHTEKGLIECYSTYRNKEEDPDKEDTCYDSYNPLYGIECNDPYAKWDRE